MKKRLKVDMEIVVTIYFNNNKKFELFMKESQYETFKTEMLLPGRYAYIDESLFINKDEIYLIDVDRRPSK